MNAPQPEQAFRVVGTRPVRPDGVDKVTGKAIYGPDFVAPGMLHGRDPAEARTRTRAFAASTPARSSRCRE